MDMVNGFMSQMFAYDAYGNMITIFNSSGVKISGSAAAFASAALASTTLLYSGEQFDTRIGQQYLRARYYDSTTGRFNRLDPFFGNLQDPQSFHKYAYAHEDPINGIDPTGKYTLTSMMATGAIIGSITGLAGGTAVGAYKTGKVFSIETLKYSLAGAALGAFAGAAAGGALYFLIVGGPSLTGAVFRQGLQSLWTKALTVHWRTSYSAMFGFALGLVAGMVDPSYEVAGMLSATGAFGVLDNVLIRGAFANRAQLATILGATGARAAIALLGPMRIYGQSAAFLGTGFALGAAAGYLTGSGLRYLLDELEITPETDWQ